MPLYEYTCVAGHHREEFRAVAERHRPALCLCGNWLTPVYSSPTVRTGGVGRDLAPASGRPRIQNEGEEALDWVNERNARPHENPTGFWQGE